MSEIDLNGSPETPDLAGQTMKASPVRAQTFASGRYVSRRVLGEGGQKVVYLVHDTALDRECALALLKVESLDADGLKRLSREAQAMARLGTQPNIVTVFDIGYEDGGRPYLVCEYVPGGDLRQELRQSEGPLPVERALVIAADIARGLASAHDRGITHRDVKPANVWLTDSGAAKLGDFGLAAALDQSRLTAAGVIMGTAAYMPPEQALGTATDARSDLYALGAVLYEMLTGRPPFLGDDSLAVISQHVNTAPVAPSWHNPAVPPEVDAIALALLAKSPDERPATAKGVIDLLDRARTQLSTATVPVPAAVSGLRGLTWGQFAGRRDEMDQLKHALEAAVSGGGALVMLSGEPGIGKTRLAQEFAVYARLRGAQVLIGRCYEAEASLPHRPFVEAIRQYARSRTEPPLRDELGTGAPEIAALVSEVRERLPDLAPAPPLEGEAQRLRLFESVTQFVRNASKAVPLVLVLDDLHWADAASLLLLRYLAHEIATERVLILGTYRDVELDRAHPLADAIATLRREPQYQRLALRGLSDADVRELLAAIQPSDEAEPARDALADALFHETEGNPFFIREVLTHLVEEGKLRHEGGRWTSEVASISELGIPEGVREVIGRRLSRLSDGCNRVLTVASMLNGGFSWQALTAVSGEDEETLLDLIDEALAAQLIHERKGDAAGTHDFTHALIRQTLYEELSGPRRVVMHRRIAVALEQAYGANADAHLPELAYHFYQAAPGGDVEKAVDYATRAGDRAMAQVAYEDAAVQYDRALQVLEMSNTPDDVRRCRLLLALGEAQMSSGYMDSGRASLCRAGDVAERLHEPGLLADAALALGVGFVQREVGRVDEVRVSLLERALSALPEVDSERRARVLAALGLDLAFSASPDRAATLAGQALEMATRTGSARALVSAVAAGYWLGAELRFTDDLIQALTDLIDADALADPSFSAELLYSQYMLLYQFGHATRAAALLDLAGGSAEQARQYLYLVISGRAIQALLKGEFNEAEGLIQQAFVAAQRAGSPNAPLGYALQLAALRRDQGRLSEIEPAIRTFVVQYPAIPTFRCGLALLYTEAGRVEDARREFGQIAAAGFDKLPRDAVRSGALAMLALACANLGDAVSAADLYDLLLPFAERAILIGGTVCWGSAAVMLGRLAATMSRRDDAERHFQTALDMNAQMGARPWLAYTQHHYAEMLLARDEPGDRARAMALMSKSLDTATELGMASLVEWSKALHARAAIT